MEEIYGPTAFSLPPPVGEGAGNDDKNNERLYYQGLVRVLVLSYFEFRTWATLSLKQ